MLFNTYQVSIFHDFLLDVIVLGIDLGHIICFLNSFVKFLLLQSLGYVNLCNGLFELRGIDQV